MILYVVGYLIISLFVSVLLLGILKILKFHHPNLYDPLE